MNLAIFLYVNILLLFLVLLGVIFKFNTAIFIFIFIIMCLITLLLFVYVAYFIYSLIKENKNFVPYVPTPMKIVKEMIQMAGVKEGDNVYDMGCGDGRLVSKASLIKNTKCIGVEWKMDVFITAKIRNFFRRGKAIIKQGDMFKEDISNADVIFTYLLPRAMDRLEDKILKECKDSVVIVSHGFIFKNLKLQEEKHIGKITIRKYSI
ncbi:MAG: 50S ribosomal protein L11 methyltransferase [Patescibacteria group bacterium]